VLYYLFKGSICLAGTCEGNIIVIDFVKKIPTRIIDDHKGAKITSLDSFYCENKMLNYWLAVSNDRRISVWSAKWQEELIQMIDWITFPGPLLGEKIEPFKELNEIVSKKYPPCLAQFEYSNSKTTKSIENLVYVGYGLQKQIIVYNFVKKQVNRTMDLSEWSECFSLSENMNFIALGTRTRLLQLKDYNQSHFQDFSQHSDTVSAMCFSKTDKKLFSAAHNEIFIWDVNV
jgi:WD40 repeat protein